MSWLLTYSGTTKSLSDWGLANLRRTRVSQAQDTVHFNCPGPFDAPELFPYAAAINISYQPDAGGAIVPWFTGRVIQSPRNGAGDSESMDYILAGPWWWLDNLVYQQSWNVGSPPAAQYKSRVILGQSLAGARLTSGQVIADVLAYAVACGAPIAIGTIEPDLNIPLDEQRDITCAEVIRRMLRWSPDAVTWFDYSTSPVPTFHCARRSALSALSLDLSSTPPPSTLSITPRPDLQVPAVVLKFEQINNVDGVDYESVVEDKYPIAATGRELGALVATLQLAGGQTSHLSQEIVTATIPVDLESDEGETWWKEKEPGLVNDNIEISIIAGSSSRLHSDLPRELVSGQIQEWLNKEAEEDVATVQVLIEISDDDSNVISQEIRVLTYKFIATDAETKTYHRAQTEIVGEAVPTGLAQALYSSLQPLHYDGEITLTEEECCASGVGAALRAASGFVLNLTGGLAAWASMKALIQQVEEDVDSGRTTIAFGPPEQLSPQDLVELLRANRGRATAAGYEKRTTGESASSAATIALSGLAPISNTAASVQRFKKLVISND